MAQPLHSSTGMTTKTYRNRALFVALLASTLLASTAQAQRGRDPVRPKAVQRVQHNPLRKLPYQHRAYAAGLLVKKHFSNQFGTDGVLLTAVNKKAANKPKGFNEGQFKDLVKGLSVQQQQVFALNTLARDSRSNTMMSAAVSKLGEMGDATSLSGLKWAMIKGDSRTIKAAAKAINRIGARHGKFGGERKVLDLSKIKDRRNQVEAVLNGGSVESVKPLSTDNHHAFDTYLVTFKNEINGQRVKAVFKPTGPNHGENWLKLSGQLHGREGAYSFVSREVFAYKFDKMLGTNLVPPTTAAVMDVPGGGKVIGSMQFFMPHSKAIGKNWKDTRGEFKQFESSPGGVRQMDTMRTLSWIMSSVEHVPSSLMGGNKGNLLVAHKDNAPYKVGVSTPGTGKRMMLIDNASSFTHKQYLSDNMLPQRFEKGVVDKLRSLDKGKFMDMATKYLGSHDANWAWGRIQHTINVASQRPTW